MPKGCFTDVIPAENARARLQEFAAGLHPLLEDQATVVSAACATMLDNGDWDPDGESSVGVREAFLSIEPLEEPNWARWLQRTPPTGRPEKRRRDDPPESPPVSVEPDDMWDSMAFRDSDGEMDVEGEADPLSHTRTRLNIRELSTYGYWPLLDPLELVDCKRCDRRMQVCALPPHWGNCKDPRLKKSSKSSKASRRAAKHGLKDEIKAAAVVADAAALLPPVEKRSHKKQSNKKGGAKSQLKRARAADEHPGTAARSPEQLAAAEEGQTAPAPRLATDDYPNGTLLNEAMYAPDRQLRSRGTSTSDDGAFVDLVAAADPPNLELKPAPKGKKLSKAAVLRAKKAAATKAKAQQVAEVTAPSGRSYKSRCPVKGCNGLGHKTGRFEFHHALSGCPTHHAQTLQASQA